MSPEAQRVAIAEACGIEQIWSYALPTRVVRYDVPDYLNDLNAIHHAEKALTEDQCEAYWNHLCHMEPEVNRPADAWTFHFSAAQKAFCILQALELWETPQP